MKTKNLAICLYLLLSGPVALAADSATEKVEQWAPYEIALLPHTAEQANTVMRSPQGTVTVVYYVEAMEVCRPNSEPERWYFSFYFDPHSKSVFKIVTERAKDSPMKAHQSFRGETGFWVIPEVGICSFAYCERSLSLTMSSLKAEDLPDARKKILAEQESFCREGTSVVSKQVLSCELRDILEPDFFDPFRGGPGRTRTPRSVEFINGRWKIEFTSIYKPDITAVVELDSSFKPVRAWQNGKQVYPRPEGWKPPVPPPVKPPPLPDNY